MVTITDWLAATGTIGLLVVAVTAIFQDKIRAWVTRPKLDVCIDVKPPDCLKIPMVRYSPEGEQTVEAKSYYFRFRVINRGNQKAESVEVFANALLKQQADNTFEEVVSFLPMNILWANCKKVFFPAISPGMYRHCDLGHIIDPKKRAQFTAEDSSWDNVPSEKTILSLDTEVKANTLSHLLPFGKYRLVILVAAANAKPVERTLEISLTGEWYDDEQRMLGEGVGVRLL